MQGRRNIPTSVSDNLLILQHVRRKKIAHEQNLLPSGMCRSQNTTRDIVLTVKAVSLTYQIMNSWTNEFALSACFQPITLSDTGPWGRLRSAENRSYFTSGHTPRGARTAQPEEVLATSWKIRGSNSGGGEGGGERDFPHPYKPALDPIQPPRQWAPGIYPRCKAAGAWR